MSPSTSAPANRTPTSALETVRFHASLNVSDLEASIRFYTALFGVPPVKAYADYAKFELDSPPVVLSLKPKRACVGGPLNHLGIRFTTLDQLEAVLARVQEVTTRIGRQDEVRCCYAKQTKLWITDPDGTLWEIYVFHDDVVNWGERHNKVKLWSAPLRAFGIRGMLRRWWNNAFGTRVATDGHSTLLAASDDESIGTNPETDDFSTANSAAMTGSVTNAGGADSCAVPRGVLQDTKR